jgi:hypothetical protein
MVGRWDKAGQITSAAALALIYWVAQVGHCVPAATSLTSYGMRTIERLAAEVREDIGLFGPIDAKVLAAWLGLELVAMPYPCDGLVQGHWVSAAMYYAMAGECCASQQIAHAACTYLLMRAGIEFPAHGQTELLAALLCGPGPATVPVAV